MKRRPLAFGFLCMLASACFGGAGEQTAPPQAGAEESACWADQTARCLCELDEGYRRCGSDGRWAGPCVCPPPEAEAEDLQVQVNCGNGVVDVGEACDDGNGKDGDGCGAACLPDGRPTNVVACPGQPLRLWPGKTIKITNMKITTVTAVDAGACGNIAAADRVYAVTAGATGTMVIKLASPASMALAVRTTCAATAPAGTELGCDIAKPNVVVQRSIGVVAGKTYYVILQPRQGAGAAYSIELGGL